MALTRLGLSAISLFCGVLVGVAATVGIYVVVHRDTVVYETTEPVVVHGIVIPKQTKLIHDAEMSEGFDRLALYINVDPISLNTYFRRRVDPRPGLVVPYWLTGPAVVCPTLGSRALPNDPVALRDLVIATKLRGRNEEMPPPCPPGDMCVEDCEAGSVCAACDRLVVDALRQLAAIGTDDAAKAAVALVLDERLGWDGGHALTLSYSTTRLGERVLPYLRPHAKTNSRAKRIVDCIDRGHPCV